MDKERAGKEAENIHQIVPFISIYSMLWSPLIPPIPGKKKLRLPMR